MLHVELFSFQIKANITISDKWLKCRMQCIITSIKGKCSGKKNTDQTTYYTLLTYWMQ